MDDAEIQYTVDEAADLVVSDMIRYFGLDARLSEEEEREAIFNRVLDLGDASIEWVEDVTDEAILKWNEKVLEAD